MISTLYKRNPNIFSEQSRELIKNSYRVNKNFSRWKDFEVFVARLNDPELIQYWIIRNISFKTNYGAQTPKQTFKRKTGDCEDFAIFGVYCSEVNGFYSRVVTNFLGPLKEEGHSVGAFKKDGKFYKYADSALGSLDISGPYSSFNETVKSIHANPTFIEIFKWWETVQTYQ